MSFGHPQPDRPRDARTCAERPPQFGLSTTTVGTVAMTVEVVGRFMSRIFPHYENRSRLQELGRLRYADNPEHQRGNNATDFATPFGEKNRALDQRPLRSLGYITLRGGRG